MFKNIKKSLIYIFLVLLSIVCLVPFAMMLVNATRSSQEIMSGFTLIPGSSLGTNWNIMSEYFNIFRGLGNSLFVSVCVTALTAYFSALTAYGFAVYNFKFKNIIFTVILVLMMVPAQLGLLGFYDLVNAMNLMDSYIPLIIPSIASPFVVFFLRQYLQSVMPMSIIEAARIDGASEFKIFHKIGIPMMGPGIATIAITTFIGSWNNYLMPLVLLFTPEKFTLPVMMASLKASTDMTTNMGATYLAIAVSVVPIMIAFAFLSKYIINSIAAGGVKE
ncbi:carbohydrate ABC transporter permease [Clostridium cuniculi]|uniref:carbohydrate ABC transporter permease n=1 Tax=Clostridium cuniculi TaxID=2548455 RepID=UPI0018AA7117|nr:carbohydrate ABC transporter permease [Clostridium cuniculi]